MEGTQRHCPDLQKLSEESQSSAGTDTSKGGKGQHERFLLKCITRRWNVRDGVDLLFSGSGDIVTKVKEKAKILSTFFASIFNGNACSLTPYVSEPQSRVCGNESVPTVWEERVRDHLTSLEVCKSVGLDGRCLRVLKVLGDVIVSLISLIFKRSQQSGSFLMGKKSHHHTHLQDRQEWGSQSASPQSL